MKHELEKYLHSLNQEINNFDGSASKNDPVGGEDMFFRALRAVAEDLTKILKVAE